MALHTQFRRKLDRLWQRRTAELRSLIKPKPGMPLAFTRAVRNRMLGELLDVASVLLVKKVARKAFRDIAAMRKLHRIKGRGLVERGNDVVAFAKRLRGPIVYSFWRGRRCLYVGKGKQASRLAGHQKSAYVTQADSIKVFLIPTKSHLPKAECLATHLFEPRDLKVKPARVRWGRKCPVCRRHDEIRKLLRALFPMR